MTELSEIELAYPLYLDVPMMTSFFAALEDGIAYGSNIKSRRSNQKALSTQGEGEAGVPNWGVLSTILSLNLRGKIERNKSVADDEEVELVKKHTEASLFMRLRKILHENGSIITVGDTESLNQVTHASLVEITGQILRSHASSTLDAMFRVLSLLGVELYDEPEQNQLKPAKHGQSHKQQPKTDFIEKLKKAFGEGGKPDNDFLLKIMSRIRDDLTKGKIVDVVMQPVHIEDLSVLIGLSSEFLLEGSFENLLSGHFTVLGKVVRVLKGDERISLYQRTTLGGLISSPQEFGPLFESMQQSFGAVASVNTDEIKAPALQLIPLGIFI